MYQVQIDKKERMDITVVSDESVSVKTWGGNYFNKDHGYTTLSYEGVCALIDTLSQVKVDMENNKTDFF